jgi:hypothetical protein
MIRLDTFRALHEHDHALAAYCPTCQRWAVLDLERLDPLMRAGLCLRRSQTEVRLLRESGQLGHLH